MAKTKKRVLSLLMAAVMMLSALPMNAFAAGETLNARVCGWDTEVKHTDECYVDHDCKTDKENCVPHDHKKSGCKKVFVYLCGKKEGACEASNKRLNCTDTTHHEHSDDCYYTAVDFAEDYAAMIRSCYVAEGYKGLLLEGAVTVECTEAGVVFAKCFVENKGAKCGLSYQLGEVKLNLCKEHFCDVCSRLDKFCNCVEITFTDSKNVVTPTVTVKVKKGTAVPAEKVPAETFVADYEFEGWFDANGNEFSTETTFTEDTTFTAQYRALTEVEKFQNIISFIENNFDLGTEIGRVITLVSGGKITKEYVLENKDTALSTVDKAAMTAMLAGQFTMEQYNELCAMMREGDEYVLMVAEWLWPENAVMMPTIEEILNGIDCEKLAAEIKDMIAERYGVEFTEDWADENKALAEQYIRECLREVKSISDAHKAAILEQLAQEKAEAIEFVNAIRNEMREQIKAEIENAKDAVKAVLANRELGLKLGKLCKAVGLNADKLSNKSTLALAALKTVISNSSIPTEQKNGLLSLLKSGDNGMTQIIAWLFPTTPLPS